MTTIEFQCLNRRELSSDLTLICALLLFTGFNASIGVS